MQLNNRFYISPEISKKVLKSIINNEKIEFKSLGIEDHKNIIKSLAKNYNSKKVINTISLSKILFLGFGLRKI